jgi:hypothetical protein
MLALISVSGFAQESEQQMRARLKSEASRALISGDYATLERLSAAYRDKRSRTPSGLWKLSFFSAGIYEAVEQQTKAGGGSAVDALLLTTRSWQEAYPTSPSAKVATAQIMHARAWQIRGDGSADSVPPGAWEPFRNGVEETRKYLESVRSTATADPSWYCLMASIAREQAWPLSRFDAFVDELLDRHPYYYPAVFCAAEYLSPRWHYQGANAIERFADRAVDKTRGEDGKALYARIYWALSRTSADQRVVGEGFSVWPKMKAGFEDLIARYPDPWNLNHYAIYSCLAGDQLKFSALLKGIGDQLLPDAWPGDTLELCRAWAARTST